MFSQLYVKSFENEFLVFAIDDNCLEFRVFIPWYLQKICSEISINDRLLCCIDRISGDGVAIDNIDHPFSFKVKHDLTITGNINASEDVKAGNISLKLHTHNVEVPEVPTTTQTTSAL